MAGDSWTMAGGVQIETGPLNHPNGATGYRVEYGGKALCYVTDTEHKIGKPDESILKLIEGADLVVYDATYTDDKFPRSLAGAIPLGRKAFGSARRLTSSQLVIFHHDPDHDDDFMRQLELDARAEWVGTIVARERMILAAG